MIRVTLYTTLGCHLCEQAMALLQHCQQQGLALTIDAVDIASDDELIARYGIRIPVVLGACRTDDLGWPFDLNTLMTYLTEES